MPQGQTTLFHTYLAILASLTLIILAFAFSIYYHVRRKRRQIKAKNLQDESNIETNNKRIAGELHDGFGSLLTGFKFSLRELSLKFPGDTQIEKSTLHLEHSIVKLREVSLNLFPPEMETHGLIVALEMLVERMNTFTGIAIHITTSFDDSDFELEKARLVYRIIQELMTNAVKHAESSVIEIGLVSKISRLLIEVRDNGKGFDFESAKRYMQSSGLKHLQSRIDMLNGILFVDSKPGAGTHYFINIPTRQLQHGSKQQN
jgi:two-component system NarL family sensor kinase